MRRNGRARPCGCITGNGSIRRAGRWRRRNGCCSGIVVFVVFSDDVVVINGQSKWRRREPRIRDAATHHTVVCIRLVYALAKAGDRDVYVIAIVVAESHGGGADAASVWNRVAMR